MASRWIYGSAVSTGQFVLSKKGIEGGDCRFLYPNSVHESVLLYLNMDVLYKVKHDYVRTHFQAVFLCLRFYYLATALEGPNLQEVLPMHFCFFRFAEFSL